MTHTKVNEPDVCDDCLLPAYDLGLETYSVQASLMFMIGAELPDHLCERSSCQCGCAKAPDIDE